LAALSSWTFAATPALSLVVSSETAPAGAWAQIKVSLTAPQQITAGYLSMDFDPAVFGPAGDVAVFSATGDAAGFAHATGTHVDVTFASPSGGVGQLPGLPVLVVCVPVLSGVATGKTTTVTVDPTGAPWNNPAGVQYSVTAAPATFQVGGTISIQSVSPAGGTMPAGTVITIQGTGFDPATTATMDGVTLSPVQYISSQQMTATLDNARELTATHLRLANSAGQRIDYFLALTSTPDNGASPWSIAPILPLTTFSLVQWQNPLSDRVNEIAWLLNQTAAPVTATFFNPSFGFCSALGFQTVTIPPGELTAFSLGHANLWMTASAPIRLLEYSSTFEGTSLANEEGVAPPIPVASLPPGSILPSAQNWQQGTPLTVNWQAGTTPPVDIPLTPPCTGDTVSVSATARPWLSVKQGANNTPSLSFDVSSLAPGAYTGTVTATHVLPGALADLPAQVATLQVILNVGASPFLAASLPGIQWNVPAGGSTPSPQVVQVQSSGAAIQFRATASTTSGGNWLSVTPAQGTAPGSLAVGVDPTGFTAFATYQGQVAIQGPANTVTLPVTVYVGAPVVPSPMSFVLEAGSAAPRSQQLLSASAVSAVSVQTQSGGNWLTATLDSAVPVITASAASLAAGAYRGTVTITTPSGAISVPVTLTVLGPPPSGVTASPSSIFVAAPAGQAATQLFTLNSAGTPALVTYSSSIGYVTIASSSTTSAYSTAVTPATLQLQVTANQPGTYYGTVTIAWDGGSTAIPITFNATAAPGLPPVVATVASAASETAGPIAQGEVIGIFGMGIGAAAAGLTLDASGKVPSQLSGAQVLIDGVPAPLIYASASQVNAIVPYETGAGGIATLQVISNGVPSAVWQLPVAPSAPALFTAGSAGVGQAAALNQNNSVNAASNPAARGEVVQIFATGGGQTSPASNTGAIAGSSGDATLLPVTVTIGGVSARVTYHGSAPGEIAGLLQIDAVVPATAPTGAAVPIFITAGGGTSVSGVTIAVK
jgi:uncharacterized protein (TIGR03437 family)